MKFQNSFSYRSFRIFFCVLLLMCLVTPLTKLDMSEINVLENRRLAVWPQLLTDGMLNANFGKQCDAWLSDRFRFRSQALEIHHRLECALGVLETGAAFVGREGWLFYKGNHSESLYTRERMFTEPEKQQIMTALEEHKAWLNEQGITFFVFVPPDKHRVYSEFYRQDLVPRRGPDRMEDLVDYLQSHNASQEVHYLLPAMLAHKADNALLYYKTDTHWNEYGAYWAYLSMMNEIVPQFKNVSPLLPEKMVFVPCETAQGDLTRMLALYDEADELTASYQEPSPQDGWSFTFERNSLPRHSYDVTPELSLSLSQEGVHTHNHGKPYRVMVFMDSFGQSLLPYLAETFGEVEYIWSHDLGTEENRRRIQAFHPDIVIVEVLARVADDLLSKKG